MKNRLVILTISKSGASVQQQTLRAEPTGSHAQGGECAVQTTQAAQYPEYTENYKSAGKRQSKDKRRMVLNTRFTEEAGMGHGEIFTLLVIRKLKIKITMNFHFTAIS